MREVEGNYVKYLKRGWNRKEGRGNKNFKKGGASWVKGLGALKKGAETPLRTMYLKELTICFVVLLFVKAFSKFTKEVLEQQLVSPNPEESFSYKGCAKINR